MNIVGIAGGSGAGKSTISYSLQDERPDLFEVLNLDDYQKLKTDPGLPKVDNMINWDHPDVIDWDNLISDIKRLKSGQAITLYSWAHRSNTDFASSGKRVPRTIAPKPIMIVEGYLALYSPRLNQLYTKSYYLDLDQVTRHNRRDKNIVIGEEDYIDKVLEPMHIAFVEPTKNHADEVIDASHKSVEEIKTYLLSQILDTV